MRIGIDLGGTKIEGIVLDRQGHELARVRTATPAGDYSGTLDAITQLVDDLERQAAIVGLNTPVGVGIPGSCSTATSLIKNANSVCLIGKPLDVDLAHALKRPVKLANDANCFAVSEASDGAGAGAGVVFGVIIGTGVGGGIAINGKIIGGINAIAGEWGHNPLPWPSDDERPGAPCYCGLNGCIETFLSGPALAADFKRTSGLNHPPHEIVKLASQAVEATSQAVEATSQAVEATLERYEQRLAKALASVINILDPDVIVLGGGLSNMARLYDAVPELWQQWVFSDRVDTRLIANQWGDSSGVRGAAWLWD